MKLRARIRKAAPIDVSGLDGKAAFVPGGWRYVVLDLDLAPDLQVVRSWTCWSQPVALDEACAFIKASTEAG